MVSASLSGGMVYNIIIMTDIGAGTLRYHGDVGLALTLPYPLTLPYRGLVCAAGYSLAVRVLRTAAYQLVWNRNPTPNPTPNPTVYVIAMLYWTPGRILLT